MLFSDPTSERYKLLIKSKPIWTIFKDFVYKYILKNILRWEINFIKYRNIFRVTVHKDYIICCAKN